MNKIKNTSNNNFEDDEEDPEWGEDEVSEFKKEKVEFLTIPQNLKDKAEKIVRGYEKVDVFNEKALEDFMKETPPKPSETFPYKTLPPLSEIQSPNKKKNDTWGFFDDIGSPSNISNNRTVRNNLNIWNNRPYGNNTFTNNGNCGNYGNYPHHSQETYLGNSQINNLNYPGYTNWKAMNINQTQSVGNGMMNMGDPNIANLQLKHLELQYRIQQQQHNLQQLYLWQQQQIQQQQYLQYLQMSNMNLINPPNNNVTERPVATIVPHQNININNQSQCMPLLSGGQEILSQSLEQIPNQILNMNMNMNMNINMTNTPSTSSNSTWNKRKKKERRDDPMNDDFNINYNMYNPTVFLENPVWIVKKNWIEPNWFLMEENKILGNYTSEDWLTYWEEKIKEGCKFDNICINDYQTDLVFKPNIWYDILKENNPKVNKLYLKSKIRKNMEK